MKPDQRKLFAVTMQPDRISCAVVSQTNSSALPLLLHAFATYPCAQGELYNLVIFNPTQLSDFIVQVVDQWHVHAAPVSIILSGPVLHEKISYSADELPNLQELGLPPGIHWQWHTRIIGPVADGRHLIYVAGMPRPITLQYHLLMRKAKMTIAQLTTQQLSLLCLYKYMYGAIFRPGLLADKLVQKNNEVEKLFTPDMLGRILHIPATVAVDRENDFVPLLNACAVMVSEYEA